MATVTLPVSRPASALQSALRAPLLGPAMGAALMTALVFVTHANFRKADPEQASIDWQILLRLGMCGLCGLYGFYHIRGVIGTAFRFPGAWCFLYALWATISIPFSVNPSYSFAAILTVWCTILFVPAVLSQLGGRNTAVMFLVAVSTYVIISWGVFLLIPSVGRTSFEYEETQYRMGGLGHPNDTGMMAALGVALMFGLRFWEKPTWKYAAALLALFALTLVLTESRTSALAAGVAASMCLWRAHKLVPVVIAGMLGVALLIGAIVFSGEDSDVLAKFTRSGETSELYEMTGRVYIWEFVGRKIEQAPILGYGYNCARYIMAEYNFDKDENSRVFHPHNLLLNVVLGNGVPGGLLFVAMILHQVVAFFRSPSTFPDIVLIMVVIGGLMEVVIFYPIPGASTLLWMTALYWRQMGVSLEGSSLQPALEGI